MPDANRSTVEDAYQHGLRLARAGRFFDAHEAFETAWRACAQEERDFFQGLVHVVVSAYQSGRGRPVAAERQRVKALKRLAAFAPAHRGLDIQLLLARLEEPDVTSFVEQVRWSFGGKDAGSGDSHHYPRD